MQKNVRCDERVKGNPHDENYIRYIVKIENVKRVRIASFIIATVFLILFLVQLPAVEWKGGTSLIIGILVMAFTFIISGVILKKFRKKWFQAFYLSFWIITILLFFLQYQLDYTLYHHIIYISMLVIIGMNVYLSHKERIGLWIMQLALWGTFYWGHDFHKEYFYYIIELSLFGFILSTIRYNNKLKEIKNEFELNSAIALSEQDALTSLLNRRGLERSMHTVWSHCIRHAVPVSVIMLDIDNFKKFNDTFGHSQGDICIKRVAEQIHRTARRKTDIVARVGGEEFLIFLSGMDKKEVLNLAMQLKENIEEMGIPQAEHNLLPIVTVSMGIYSDTPQKGNVFSSYSDEADINLYKAKEKGKACIIYDETCYGKKKPSEYQSIEKCLLPASAGIFS